MDSNLFPNLQSYFANRLPDTTMDGEERAQIENFLLDERLAPEGQARYNHHLGNKPIASLNEWQRRHNTNYVKKELQLDRGRTSRPWTFRPENDFNRLRQIKPELYLVRVEDAAWPCSLIPGASPEIIQAKIDAFAKGDDAARVYLERFAEAWNLERDQRPQYATTLLEVEDILDEDGPDWAERLRDRLGLGDYDPGVGGEPVAIFLMRYTVSEVIAALEGQGHPAVPTVLDGKMSQFFYPSPKPADGCGQSPYGHTLNLSPVDAENDYRMGVELLHPLLDYKPEHFYRVGYIKQPVAMPLERARSFHLPWLRLQYDREDFGGQLASVVS